VRIDNPELLAKLKEAQASKVVAEAELARINAGTRQEVVASRKAEIDRADANLTLARQTYERTRQLTSNRVASQAKLDEVTDALQLAQRGYDQAKLSYEEAVAGFHAGGARDGGGKGKKRPKLLWPTVEALVNQAGGDSTECLASLSS
jgi:HlyD family secretion protein